MAQRDVNSKFGDVETVKFTSYFVPTVMDGTLQLMRLPSSSFNSRFWVHYEVKRTVIEFLICWKAGWVQSERMLDAVTSRQNIVRKTRLPSAPGTLLYV